jgi:hypothetical protein
MKRDQYIDLEVEGEGGGEGEKGILAQK